MTRKFLFGLCIVLLAGGCCYGQSLGDAARENRSKKSAEGAASRRVISNDDLSAQEVIHLVPGKSSTGEGTLVAPGRGKHNYHVILLDASQFENGGTIHITITVGDGKSEASFDLYPQGVSLPEEGMPNSLVEARNIASGTGTKLNYRFTHGTVFQFGAEGSWNAKAGATNTFSFVVDVDGPPSK